MISQLFQSSGCCGNKSGKNWLIEFQFYIIYCKGLGKPADFSIPHSPSNPLILLS